MEQPLGSYITPERQERIKGNVERQTFTPRLDPFDKIKGINQAGEAIFSPENNSVIANRTRRGALRGQVGDPGVSDWLLYGITSNVAAYSNQDEIEEMKLWDSQNGFTLNRQTGQYVRSEEITSKNIKEFLSPFHNHILSERGFDYSVLEDLNLDTAKEFVARTILNERLDREIEAGIDSKVERFTTGLAAFGGELVDPSLLAGLGAGTALKKGGASLLRLAAKNEKNRILRAAGKVASRASSNGTVTGTLIDNAFTRKHVATSLGVDTAFATAAFDLHAQRAENEVLTRYYSDAEAEWFSPGRLALSMGAGGILGAGLGRLFGVGNINISRREAVKNAMDIIDPEGTLPTEVRSELTNSFNVLHDYVVPHLKDGTIPIDADNADEIREALDDMLHSVLEIYNAHPDRVDGVGQGDLLKERVREVLLGVQKSREAPTADEIRRAGTTTLAHHRQLEMAETAIRDAEVDLREAIRLRDLFNKQTRSKSGAEAAEASGADIEATKASFKEHIANMKQKVEDAHTIRNEWYDKLQVAREAETALAHRQQNVNRVGGDALQARTQAAVHIADFFSGRPTLDEANRFLDALDPHPTKERLAYIKQRDALSKSKRELRIAEEKGTALPTDLALMRNSIDVAEKKLNNPSGAYLPEVRTTGFRKALEKRETAASAWETLKGTRDAVERQKLLDLATRSLDEANELIEKTRKGIVPVVSDASQSSARDLNDEARRVSLELQGLLYTPVTKQSKETARMLIESHYLSPEVVIPRIRNDNAVNNVFYHPVVNKIAGILTPREELEAIAQTSPELMTVIEMVHSLSDSTKGYRLGQKHVGTVTKEFKRAKRTVSRTIEPHVTKLRKDLSDEEFNKALAQATRIAYLPVEKSKTSNKDIHALAEGMRFLYQDFETLARKSGLLQDSEPNHVHVQLVGDILSNVKGRDTLIEVYGEHLVDVYDPRKKGAPVSRAALNRLNIIAKDGQGNWTLVGTTLRKTDTEDAVPNFGVKSMTTEQLDDLLTLDLLERLDYTVGGDTRPVLEAYLDELPSAIKEEATKAVSNKSKADATVRTGAGNTSFDKIRKKRAENSRYKRKIPLSVLLDQRVLDTGVIQVDPLLNFKHYWSSFGFDVAEQKIMDDLLGQRGVSFDDFLEWAVVRAKERNVLTSADGSKKNRYTDQHYRNIEKSILAVRDMAAGRAFTTTEESTFLTGIASFIAQVTSIPINARIPFMMPTTEMFMPALLHVMVDKNRGHALGAMLKSFKESMDKTERRALGMTFDDVMVHQRVLQTHEETSTSTAYTYWDRLSSPFRRLKDIAGGEGQAASFQSKSRASNLAVGLAEAASETTRNISTELVMTRVGQTAFGKYSVRMLQHRIPAIQKAAKLLRATSGQPTEKELAGIARKAGLRLTDMQTYITHGIISKENPTTDFLLGYMKEIGVEDFGKVDEVYRIIEGMPEGSRKAGVVEVWEKVLDVASAQVDKDITNPGIFDRPAHGNHPAVMLISRYLSFGRGFRSGKMQDLANLGAAGAALGGMGYLLSEIWNRAFIDIWLYNRDIDEVYDEWTNDTAKKTLFTAASLPVFGGGQGILTNVISGLMDGRRIDPTFSPATNIFTQQLDGVRKLLTGEDMDEEARRRALLNVPIVNNGASQLLLNMVRDDEEE